MQKRIWQWVFSFSIRPWLSKLHEWKTALNENEFGFFYVYVNTLQAFTAKRVCQHLQNSFRSENL